jgi:hypothetical protein
MKKFKKSRVVYASLSVIVGPKSGYEYYLVTPYDKKGREIPSSVNCAYNSAYFESEEAMLMSEAL